ncbi:hypothetical protein HZH66_013801 [Vespula vulgaris]|uniref:Uncharacterized protein n=1 Tax=Vespula vulgaris TaxID=7454 RepID=A0A834MQC3_VESVU|nr:hypothetical protein HZH66_013801 [Vespula vulgaris]
METNVDHVLLDKEVSSNLSEIRNLRNGKSFTSKENKEIQERKLREVQKGDRFGASKRGSILACGEALGANVNGVVGCSSSSSSSSSSSGCNKSSGKSTGRARGTAPRLVPEAAVVAVPAATRSNNRNDYLQIDTYYREFHISVQEERPGRVQQGRAGQNPRSQRGPRVVKSRSQLTFAITENNENTVSKNIDGSEQTEAEGVTNRQTERCSQAGVVISMLLLLYYLCG